MIEMSIKKLVQFASAPDCFGAFSQASLLV